MTSPRAGRQALVTALLLALGATAHAAAPYEPPRYDPPADENATVTDDATATDDYATTAAPGGMDAIRAALDEKRYGTAVLLCEQARRGTPDDALPLETRAVCGRALVQLGDKLYAVGSLDGARARWNQAAALDPRLLDDPAFTARLEAAEQRPKDTPKPKVDSGPRPNPEPEPEPEPVRPADAGPRWDRGFGAGIGAGFDGVGAILVSWMTDGTIAVDFSVGMVFPVFDVRVRWYGLQDALTPVVGLGMTTPFGDGARFGDGLDTFHNLYELGESLHVDLGMSWAPTAHLDVFAGITPERTPPPRRWRVPPNGTLTRTLRKGHPMRKVILFAVLGTSLNACDPGETATATPPPEPTAHVRTSPPPDRDDPSAAVAVVEAAVAEERLEDGRRLVPVTAPAVEAEPPAFNAERVGLDPGAGLSAMERVRLDRFQRVARPETATDADGRDMEGAR